MPVLCVGWGVGCATLELQRDKECIDKRSRQQQVQALVTCCLSLALSRALPGGSTHTVLFHGAKALPSLGWLFPLVAQSAPACAAAGAGARLVKCFIILAK